jgi:hypothetical protein
VAAIFSLLPDADQAIARKALASYHGSKEAVLQYLAEQPANVGHENMQDEDEDGRELLSDDDLPFHDIDASGEDTIHLALKIM